MNRDVWMKLSWLSYYSNTITVTYHDPVVLLGMRACLMPVNKFERYNEILIYCLRATFQEDSILKENIVGILLADMKRDFTGIKVT